MNKEYRILFPFQQLYKTNIFHELYEFRKTMQYTNTHQSKWEREERKREKEESYWRSAKFDFLQGFRFYTFLFLRFRWQGLLCLQHGNLGLQNFDLFLLQHENQTIVI